MKSGTTLFAFKKISLNQKPRRLPFSEEKLTSVAFLFLKAFHGEQA
jgi:hypothetical protein